MEGLIIRPKSTAGQPEGYPGVEVIGRPRLFRDRPHLLLAKRVIDLVICVLAAPVIVPVMMLCALLVRCDSPGPIIFVQERIGKGGKRFKMFKFRTMPHKQDDQPQKEFMKKYVTGELKSDAGGKPVFKPQARVTRIGGLLRKTSLDELPQLINVVRGEMSIVGPRPNMSAEVEHYKLWQHERLEVLPGLTGLAQIHGRSSLEWEQIVQYDIQYIENMSLALDFEIILKTFVVVLKGLGAR
jgi:lipopolysaccharide/colanic/teichoic acid biosynthesis glycosyltransferase